MTRKPWNQKDSQPNDHQPAIIIRLRQRNSGFATVITTVDKLDSYYLERIEFLRIVFKSSTLLGCVHGRAAPYPEIDDANFKGGA